MQAAVAVICEPNELVAPIHLKAIVTILDADERRAGGGSYENVIALKQPYHAERIDAPPRGVSDTTARYARRAMIDG